MLEELHASVTTAQIGAYVAQAVGGQADPPQWTDVRSEFDAWLLSVPPRADSRDLVLVTALGLR